MSNTARTRSISILLFPIGWIVVILLLCALRLDAMFAGIVAFGAGAFLYLYVQRLRRRETSRTVATYKTVLAVLMVMVLSLGLTRTYYWITWDPIGEAYDNGWGRFALPDVVDTFKPVSNGHGIVVVVRRTRSGFPLADAPIPYFVFVHKADEKETRQNLALRYDSTPNGWNSRPKFTWLSKTRLNVALPDGGVLRITKQRGSVEGVQIIYSGRARTTALNWWQRPFL